MNVQCAACETHYEIDATKVPQSGGFIRCKTCGERVRIPPPPREPASAIPLAGTPDHGAPPVTRAPAAGAIPLAGTPADEHEAATGAAGDRKAVLPVALPESRPAGSTESASRAAAGAIPLSSALEAGPEEAFTGNQPAAPPGPEAPGAEAPGPTPTLFDDLPAAMPDQAPSLAAADDLPALDDQLPTPAAATPDQRPSLAAADDLPALDDQLPTPAAATPDQRSSLAAADDLPALDDQLPAPMETVSDLDVELVDLPTSVDTHDAETEAKAPGLDLSDDFQDSDIVGSDGQPPRPQQPATDLPTAFSEDDGGAQAPEPSQPLQLSAEIDEALGTSPAFDDLPNLDADAPRLMEDSLEGVAIPPDDSILVDAAPGSAAEVPDSVTTEAGGGQQPVRASHSRIIAVGAVLSVILLAGIGYTLRGLFIGNGGEAPHTATTPPPDSSSAAGVAPKTPPAVAPPDATQEPAPHAEPKPAPGLTIANVDRLPFLQLQAATANASKTIASGDAEGRALLSWARFRLATSYGEPDAGKALTAKLLKPKAITKLDGLAAAAAIGALAYAGKSSAARKIGEKLQRGKLKESPQLALALATTFRRKAETPKALRQLEHALRLAPDMADAQLMRGRLLLQGRDRREGVRSLVELGATADDIDTTLRAAEYLLAAEQLQRLDRALKPLEKASQADAVPPPQRDTLLRLLVRKRVRAGDLAGASEAAKARAEAAPSDTNVLLEHVRLLAATGGDAGAAIETALARVSSPRAKAQLVAEQVRMALGRNKADEAQTALDAGRKIIAGKQGSAWLALAEGWIARQKGDIDAARAAFKTATKGREKLGEAKLAETLLAAGKPGPLMKKLGDLDKKHELPEASYHLARMMREHGNTGGAVELYDRVLWHNPTVVDPVELLLEWTDLLDTTGRTSQAETVAKALHELNRKDSRPPRMLANMARRAGKWNDAVEWTRVLMTAVPNDFGAKVEHADALIGAGKESEAQTMLAELFKEHPEARTPTAMVTQARAWMKREPFKAKELLKESLLAEPKADTYILLAQLEAGRGRNDAAKNAYNKAIELDPKATAPRIAVARIFIEERAVAEGAAILEKVLAKQPNDAGANELLGDALVDLDKPQDAIDRYTKALELAGERAPLLMKVARVQLQHLGQLAAAVRTLRRAIKVDSKYAEPHYYLGLALKDMNQKGEAKQALLSYVRLAPDGEFANDARRLVNDLEKL